MKMLLLNIIFSALLVLRTGVYCEVDIGIQATLLNGFVDGLNNLPEKAYIYDNGVIIDAQKEGDKLYKIQAKLQATDIANEEIIKHMQCSATIQLAEDKSVGINDHQCDEQIQGDVSITPTPSDIEHKPLVLDNEVSTDTAVTSGEQFVAVPKNQCIGCSSHVDTDAPGVSDLAALGVKHIDLHEPDVKHELNHVLEVQREVQIVNGVRYILKLSVDYTNSSIESDTGSESNTGLMCNKICSITILEKPWAKLPDGSKYRAILANNCTAEWLFGDEGEVISGHETKDDNNGEIKQVHTEELSSVPKTERILTIEEIRALEEQIIPHNSVIPAVDVPKIVLTNEIPTPELDIKNAQELQSGTYYTTSEITNNKDSSNLSEDKKKSIDELMNIFEFSEFNPTSVSHRSRRSPQHIPGGEKEKNINDQKYQLLAQKSLDKFVSTSGKGQNYKVINIEKVTEQVVSGKLTKIIFNIALNGNSVTKCESKVWEQPWLGQEDIDVKCNLPTQTRKKRQLIGGATVQNPKDSRYKLLADESLKKYVSSSGNGFGSQVVSVDRVTEQVVAGTLTKLDFTVVFGSQVAKCHSKVWEKVWLQFKDIKVECDFGSNNRTRRSNNVLGGEYTVDKEDSKYILLAEKSMNKFVNESGKKQKFRVVGITKAVQQVVNGFITKLDFKIQPIDNSAVLLCHSEIHEGSSKDSELTIEVNCNPLLGGSVEKDVSEPKYQSLAQESLNSYTKESKLTLALKVYSVEKVTEQLVNGLITEIDFKISTMDNANIYNCHSKVYTSFIKPITKEIKVECDLAEHKISKRSVHYARNEELSQPGPVDTSPLDSETANVFANTALKHIEAKYPHPRKQAIVKIFSAMQAIVAGKHYRLKVEVGITNCTALSTQENCQLVTDSESRLNRFCKVNMWAKANTEHPPSYRVTCDDQNGNSSEVYHHIQAERLFYNFLTTHQPSYLDDQAEMYKRFNVFKDNIRKIHDLNIYERGTATYAVTKFADLTYEEFSRKYLGLKPSLRNMNFVPMRKAVIPDTEVPSHFDWRDKGAVTEVKNQGSCGSCWAFSVTGNIEGQWKLKSGKLVSLSEQELVDCDKLDQGCNGGLPDNAYRAIEQLGGLETESDYPYDGSDDKCAYNRTLSRVTINGAVNISSNEQDMAKWLVSNGPISIGINANAMQFYVGGISHPWKVLCNSSNLDHGVLIVGYGAKDYPLFKKHLPYWTIKNSWGPSWGEQGYYRVYRGDGTCGVNKMASSAVIT